MSQFSTFSFPHFPFELYEIWGGPEADTCVYNYTDTTTATRNRIAGRENASSEIIHTSPFLHSFYDQDQVQDQSDTNTDLPSFSSGFGAKRFFDELFSHLWIISLSLFCLWICLYYARIYFGPCGKLMRRGVGSLRIYPLIGSIPTVLYYKHDLPGLLRVHFDKFGKSFLIYNCSQVLVATKDIELIKAILSDPVHVGKSGDYKQFAKFMGTGLLTSNVEKWKVDRKMLMPGVKSPSLFSTFLVAFNRNSNQLVEILRAKFPSSPEPVPGSEIENVSMPKNIYMDIGRCTLEIVLETLFDIKPDIQLKPNCNLLDAALKMTHLMNMHVTDFERCVPPIYWLTGLAKQQKKYIGVAERHYEREFNARNKRLAEEGDVEGRPVQLADILVQNYSNDVPGMFSHIFTFIGAGFETTATTTNNTLFLLGSHPEVQNKLFQELEQVFQGDYSRETTSDDLSKLEYMEQVIKESMRLMTPAPFIGRTLGKDIRLQNGNIFQKGAEVWIFMHDLHHDEDLYPNPEAFIPERWTMENSVGRSPYAFIPFSAGPRSCFGNKYAMMELKTILSKIIPQFEISTDRKFADLQLQYGINLHVKGGLPLTLSPRIHSNQ